jgi:catechol 2,3-dioxygenase-like lactoylglutathione lyase family enzyme
VSLVSRKSQALRFESGVNHIAYVTFNPAATVDFYTNVLGLELAHCVTAKGWGPKAFPDFAHFFFKVGSNAHIAFFYYFGAERPAPAAPNGIPRSAHHLSLHCDTFDELDAWEEHLRAHGCVVSRTPHETITSIYFKDPNGLQLEITCPNRQLAESDVQDAWLSVRALLRTLEEPDPTVERMWQIKGELVSENGAT